MVPPLLANFVTIYYLMYKIVLAFIILIFKSLTRLFVFPGSYSLWKRNVESNYAKAFSKRALIKISNAINLVDAIT